MQSDLLSQTLYEISNAVNTTEDLNQLYQKIHQSLSNILDVTNFYIAMYDSNEEMIHFPYYIDHRSKMTSGFKYSQKERKGSLTSLVIQKGESVVLSKQDVLEYCRTIGAEPSGPLCEIWVGVPLIINKEVIGIIALQSYDNPDCYSDNDLKLLNSISDQIAIALDRKKSQTRYKNLIENIKDIIYITNSSGRITYVSQAVTSITGFNPEELTGRYRWFSKENEGGEQLFELHESDLKSVTDLIEKSVAKLKSFESEHRIIKKDGTDCWVLERGQFLKDDMENVYLEGSITDIQERKRAEQINRALYDISNAVNATRDLDELYESIYQSVITIINAQRFGIGLYSKEKDYIEFPFNVETVGIDTPGKVLNASKSTSLTAEVIRSKKPKIFSKEEMIAFAKARGGNVIGTATESWLGVPLAVKGEIIGAMVIETMNPNKPYTQEDIECLSSISDQVAIAIERKLNEEQIRTREKVITALYNISNAMHTTRSLHQLYESIHRSLEDILDVQNFMICFYDEKSDTLKFEYCTDSMEILDLTPIKNASKTSSLVYRVVKNKQPLLFNDIKSEDIYENNNGYLIGEILPKCWTGVPLRGKTKILGAIVIQSYSDSFCYDEKDNALLESISEQIAFAIEYKNAENDLLSAQNELLEKAHKAGMADIASDTIHNLGNILNSVKTSNEMINEIVTSSQHGNFSKAVELLKEKINSIKDFICNDPNGEKLMRYLISIEETLSSEFEDIGYQAARLTEKIQLMTNVIRTQQNYVNEEFLEEDHYIVDIVDKVLKMHAGLFKGFGINIVKKYSDVPKILVQKTKLEYIIMNIINNAKDSMENVNNRERTLTVSLNQDLEHIYLRFEDNGNGIAQHNLQKIFTHGFTTKSHGHGFGLHNAANFLSEMKANIWAESEGPGRGSTFVLRFQKR